MRRSAKGILAPLSLNSNSFLGSVTANPCVQPYSAFHLAGNVGAIPSRDILYLKSFLLISFVDLFFFVSRMVNEFTLFVDFLVMFFS